MDISLAETSTSASEGQSIGQTFLAQDTVITRLRVWRLALNQPNATPMKAWIVRVDPANGKPLPAGVIREGPTIQVPFGDGINHTPIEFDFDPPVVLPWRGEFAFFVQELCWGSFNLMITQHSVYPDGMMWRTDRSIYSGCVLRGNPDGFVDDDMMFDIEFCDTATTPTRRTSWGQLRAIYR